MTIVGAVSVARVGGAFRDSLFASGIGFALSVLLIELIFYSRFAPYFGTFLAPWIANVCSVAGSFAGWLLFLLPVALTHRTSRWNDHIAWMCVLGGAVGFLFTFIETLPLAGYAPGVLTMREFYIATGVLNASTATACLIVLRRKAARHASGALTPRNSS